MTFHRLILNLCSSVKQSIALLSLQFQYFGPNAGTFEKVDAGGTRMEFYIAFDW